MSQQAEGNTEKPQQNVRVVPIFVEGRDAPVINKDFPDTSGPQHQHHHVPEPPRMASNIDFGADMPPFSQGSIFERAKNIPVRSTMKDHFKDLFRDSESPLRNIPVNHMDTAKVHKRHASPQPQQVPQQQQNERARTFSGGAPQQAPPQPSQQQQQQQQPEKPKAAPQQPQQQQQPPKKEQTPPPPVAKAVDAITKIQQIQKDVLDLMVKVEHFEGKTKKDKEYLYLDEMLTQNLLKLDTVDTDGKENVKLARKEAVKCINRCLNVLEAKAEAAAEAGQQASKKPDTHQDADGEQSQPQQQPAGPAEPSKTSSRSSVYDNHDVEQPASSEAAAESPHAAAQQGTAIVASQPAA